VEHYTVPARRHAVSDIYTTDHNRLPSVDCDTFGLTANVSGIKVWVIPLQHPISSSIVFVDPTSVPSAPFVPSFV
jgi:hypothetical protein